MRKICAAIFLAVLATSSPSPAFADIASIGDLGKQAPRNAGPAPRVAVQNVATITATCDYFFWDGTLSHTTVNSWKALPPIQIPGTTSGTWEDPDSGITYTFACTYTAVL
jgi:hypothetical protein